jgi:hypothetical protein
MNAERRQELEAAIKSEKPLTEIVALLRRYKELGVLQSEVYAFLEAWHQAAPDEATADRILDVADCVVGFCSSHMRIWDSERA